MPDARLVEHAQRIIGAALDAVAPERLVEDLALADLLPRPLPSYRRCVVLGVGKASLPFAAALEARLASVDGASHVVVPHDYCDVFPKGRAAPRQVQVLEATHPVPDAASVTAANRALSVATACTADDLVLVLISGGGSALWTAPPAGLSLNDLRATTQLLLRSGADIRQLNTVRKHLSRIKGGRLALAAAPATLCALVLSDVVGDDLAVIASGPTVPDPSTFFEARAVLRGVDAWEAVPPAVRRHLDAGCRGEVAETPTPEDPAFRTAATHLIGGNILAVEAAARAAEALGYHGSCTTGVTGEARTVGRDLAAHIRHLDGPSPAYCIWGGETTVTVTGPGRGGRNQEVALGAALELHDDQDVVVLAAGTDGVDGPTDAAGAWVTADTVATGRRLGREAQDALARNDAYPFFDALGQLVRTGPTHTNVMDVYIALRGPAPG